MKNWKKYMALAGILAVMLGVTFVAQFPDALAAQSGVVNTPTKDAGVGGLPLFVTFSATSKASEEAITFTLPAGFLATFVRVVDDYNASGSNICEWHSGMPAASAMVYDFTSATAPVATAIYDTTDGITVTAGSIIVGVDCQVNDGDVWGMAFR